MRGDCIACDALLCKKYRYAWFCTVKSNIVSLPKRHVFDGSVSFRKLSMSGACSLLLILIFVYPVLKIRTGNWDNFLYS